MRIVRIMLITFSILSLGIFGVSEIFELVGRDTDAPEITSDREILEIPCEYTEEQLMEGLAASDTQDGDLTDLIMAGPLSRFIAPGTCNVTYVVFDSANRPAQLTRKVRFTDYHPPRFTLSEPLVFAAGEAAYAQLAERIGAVDLLDGNRSEWITQTESNVNYRSAGSYTVNVRVTSSLGDSSEAALPVHVVDAESSQMEIRLNTGLVYLSTGEAFDPYACIVQVTGADGSQVETSAVEVSSGVDIYTPGTYEVNYQVADSYGHRGETWMTVIVEEKGGAE